MDTVEQKSYSKKSSLYIPSNIDFIKEPMFLGTGKNTQRFDNMKYPFFDEKNAKMQGLDWAFDEAKLKTDYVDFNTRMHFHEQFIYTKVLQKLIFLDSLQGRGILLTLGQIVSLPELENAMLTWQYFEGAKHSKTYTENLRGVYDNPAAIFDESFEIPELMKLAKSISNPYNECYELIIEMQYKIIKNLELTPEFMKELKKSVIKLIVVINILEGVRFYSGFASIWAMNKGQGYVEGTSKNLKFICLHPESEILTENGWTKIEEVSIKDKIAQYDMENGEVTFDYATRKTWVDYKGPMYKITDATGKTVQHLAKDHEVVVKTSAKIKKEYVQNLKFNCSKHFPQGGIYSGGNENITSIDKFRIMVQADGHINPRFNGSISGNILIEMSLKKQRKIDSFFNIMNGVSKYGITFKERNPHKNGCRVFHIAAPLELNIDKTLDFIKVSNFSQQGIEDILQEIISWDGSVEEDRYYFGTTCYKTYIKVLELAVVSKYQFNTCILKNKQYKDMFIIHLKNKNKLISTGSMSREEYEYDGKIGCVTMPKGTIITKSVDNKVVVTGNCRDENQHLAMTQKILQILRKTNSEGFTDIYEEMRPQIVEMYSEAYIEEAGWIDFSFQHGSIIGLNADISKHYLKYLINRRLKSIGENILFQGFNTNPIPWIDPYINMDKSETLPQEGEVQNYVTGGVDTSSDIDFSKLKGMIW